MEIISAAQAGGIGNAGIIIIYVVGFGALMYFMSYLPQKKAREKKAALIASMAVGDSVLTEAGFYGVLIDITEDMVIVEFGNNKNCRIPMRKESIIEIEKPE